MKVANQNTSYRKNLKMDQDVYKLRREVINYVYEAKALLNGNLPRIDVRVVEYDRHNQHVAGQARLNANTIWINQEMIKGEYRSRLRWIVFHEIVHAVTGFDHDDNCDLMCPIVKTISKSREDKAFLKYFK